jgi:hypothetical protein
MHWDVVEVKPLPNYCLFVRFADELSGKVQLREEQFIGALSPLRDVRFFGQAFLEHLPGPARSITLRMRCTKKSPVSPRCGWAEVGTRQAIRLLQRLITPSTRVACHFVGDLAVRAEAVISVLAPKQPVVAVLDRGVPFGLDEQAFPMQVLATLHADVSQSWEFHIIPFR